MLLLLLLLPRGADVAASVNTCACPDTRAVVRLLLLRNDSGTGYTQAILYWAHPPPSSFPTFLFPPRQTPDSLDMQMSSEYHYLRVLVIPALSTLGIPEDSFFSAFSTLRTRED